MKKVNCEENVKFNIENMNEPGKMMDFMKGSKTKTEIMADG